MNIAVLSGKGGTGKTFVSVNLASVIGKSVYVDCDVEEPNGHLFFKPEGVVSETVFISLPDVDADKCNGCRKCVDFCRFNAIAFVKGKPFRFKEVCHACGGCKIVCPVKAVCEKEYPIGVINTGKHGGVTVISGVMNTGEESGVPIIRRLMDKLCGNDNIIDCPPGSACTVMESTQKADYCILVAEPTLFGVHNFLMVYELIKLQGKPFGVVINKDDGTDNPMVLTCKSLDIPVLMRIPYEEGIARDNAAGIIASESSLSVRRQFEELYRRVCREVKS